MRGTIDMGRVVDDVLAEANTARTRRQAEVTAIKVAEAQPRTPIARGLRSLAHTLRTTPDDITYADLRGLS